MRAVLTRVNSASVAIDGEVVGKIGKGFLILLGVGPNDTEKECRYLAEKALGLRIFTDENDKMKLGLDAVGGEGLVVSQFTSTATAARAAAPALPTPRTRNWGSGCMSSSLPTAPVWGIPLSTAASART